MATALIRPAPGDVNSTDDYDYLTLVSNDPLANPFQRARRGNGSEMLFLVIAYSGKTPVCDE